MRFKLSVAAILAIQVFTPSALAQERLADLLSDPSIRLTRPADRAQVVARIKNLENDRRQNAHARATLRGLPLRTELRNGRVQEIVDFEGDLPVYLTTDNVNAAISTGANLLQAAPYSLTGAGVTIGLWDGGAARSTHQEFGSRLSVMDGSTNIIDHASHVGGTLIASGVNGVARGMATGATVNSYDWNNDTSEMTSRGAAIAGDPGKIYLSNHSYNYVSGWNYVNGGSPFRTWEWNSSGTTSAAIEADFGLYNSFARDSDSLVFNAPYYLIFRSAGNDNNDNPSNGESVSLSSGSSTVVTYNSANHPAGDGNYRGGFETIGFNAVAKNVITVGSAQDAVTNGTRNPANANLNSFSACGPTDDGRIKPDVVANGDSLYSSFGGSDTAYGTLSGTSMSTPNAAGSAALLIEQYGMLFPGQAMRASTLKGLLIHTANDQGNAGPDYRYGWGLVNVQAAADLIRDHYNIPAKLRITENQLTTSIKTRTHSFTWDGVSPIRATLVWTDPAGASSFSDSRTPNLVNNLNLKIIAPNGSESLPYVMPFVGTWTVASMSTPATTGINNTDNIEQVNVLTPPVLGTYQAVVACPGTLTTGIQNYSLLISGSFAEPPLPPSPPANLIASPRNNTVNLTWSASDTATRYTIKRSLNTGGPYTILGNTTTTSYTDTAAINGNSYFYVVSGSNSAGEGSDSGEVSAIPGATPSTTTLTASPVASSSYGSSVTLTATVSGGAVGGIVTFRDDMTILGTGTVNSSSQASYTTTSLALGSHFLSADFAGNSIFAPSTSPTLAYAVNPKLITISGVLARGKVYDGNTSAELTGGTVSGLVAGETVTITPGTGSFSSADAGLRGVVASSYSIGGTHAANYQLSAQPVVPDATITPLPLQLSGTRTYDGTNLATNILTPQNTLNGASLSLTGEIKLADRNIGLKSFSTNTAASRIQTATGTTGSSSASSFNVTLAAPPGSGNTLIAVISTRGISANRVSAITQVGASWSRASQATNTGGTTTEIWFASNVSGAGTAISVSQAALRSTAVVMEYRGVLVANPLDRSTTSTGNNTTPVTGTTTLTSQANELWIGGIGIADGRRTLNAPYGNSFIAIASPKSGTSISDSMVYAFEKTVSATATASTGATLSSSDAWAGTLVTFRTVTPDNLTLSGSAAGNYTLLGATGSVQITPYPVTLTAFSTTKTYDGTTIAAGTPTLDPALIPGDTVTALSQVFLDANAGIGNKVIAPSITINDGNGGANYSVTAINNTGSIFPATATISLANLSQTFDGAPKPVTVTTPPEVSSVVITYDGSTTAPVNAGTYVVTATITDPNYQGGAIDSLIITPGNDFISWKNLHFSVADQLLGLADDIADPDADNRPNLAEYALGSDPNKFSPALMATRDEDGLSLVFTRPAGLPNITYDAESSEDLETWLTLPLEVLTTDPVETLRARDPLTSGNPAQRFLRLRFGRQ